MKYLPNPTEVEPQPEIDLEGNETGEKAIVDPDKPFRALAFKIMDDRYGALTFTRIYSGKVNKGDNVLNTFTGKTERIGRIVEMHADSREELDSAQAGDIVAFLGMKNTQTGHTLADEKNPATLEPMVFPDPVISIAIAAKDKAGTEKMGIALGKMIAEDPSFQVETDQETGESVMKGMGELHLDIKVDILKSVPTASKSKSANRRWPIARRLPSRSPTATPTRSRRVVRVSSVRSTTRSSRSRPAARTTSLNRRSPVVTCRANTGARSRMRSRR